MLWFTVIGAVLMQLLDRGFCGGSSKVQTPGTDQHSGSLINWGESAVFAMASANSQTF